MSNPATPLDVRPVRAFADNYIWLIGTPYGTPYGTPAGQVVVVDPGDPDPVIAELRRTGESLAAILLTHHHADHIGGVAGLLALGAVPVIGPDDPRVSRRTQTAKAGERCALPDLGLAFDILAVPGHTLSHIAFWGHGALFCGDTLFSAGCGRMFEGTPSQMNSSLNQLRELPPETRMFCGHEYTAANLRFALAVDPDNAELRKHRETVDALRADDLPSVPSAMSLELRINPFLRCDDPTIRAAAEAHIGRPLPAASDVFGVLRAWKDQF